jgi:hypothetical protein
MGKAKLLNIGTLKGKNAPLNAGIWAGRNHGGFH